MCGVGLPEGILRDALGGQMLEKLHAHIHTLLLEADLKETTQSTSSTCDWYACMYSSCCHRLASTAS